MVARVLALGALVALGYSKAIVTNNCRKDVYIWSVPEKADLANNLSISPGKRYEEPWRPGTAITPGVAIKVTTEPDGIYTGKSEINFQYDIDPWDSTKIWIDLATIHGNDFDTATLNTCHGGFKGPSVATTQCSSTDDIELVLCGSDRTVPSQDSTPVRVISSCIGLLAERDDPLNPRMCSGRVVGPKRMPMLPEEQEDQWLDERVDTVPLKTVMRLEAAKHAASQDPEAHNAPRPRTMAAARPETAAKKSMSSTPMCNFLHEVWPDAQCNEEIAQHNAKLFYQDNCGDKTRTMFPGASCEAIRHQMEQIYPGVATFPKPVKQDSHRTLCITPYYQQFVPFWGTKDTVHEVFNHESYYNTLFPDRSWTSDEEVCRNSTRKVWPIVGLTGHHRVQRCVLPFCDKGYPLGGDCSDVEDALEALSKDAGFEIDWTSDDDACGDKRAATEKRDVDSGDEHSSLARRQVVNVTLGTGHRWNDIRKVCITTANEKLGKYWGVSDTEDIIEELFPRTSWTANLDDCSPQAISESRSYHRKLIDKNQKKEKKCVVNCDGKTCKRVKKELNKLSKDVGENWSWTDDEKVCATSSNITFGSDGPTANICVLGRNAINKLSTYWGDARDEILDDLFSDFETRFTVSDGSCSDFAYDQAARKWFKDHRPKGKRVQRCVSPYCEPFNADCSDVEDQLEEVSKNVGHAIDWTTDDDACPKDAVYSVSNAALNRIAFGEEGPELCRSILGYGLVTKLRGYWGVEAEEVLDDIFPSLAGFQLNRDCDQGEDYIKAGRKWFHDHRVKGGQRCVEPYCKPFNADCSDVEDVLEEFSKKIGQDIDWTTDDDACPKNVIYPVNPPPLTSEYLEDPTTYTYNTSLPLVCSREYCAPRVPGVDCALVHRDFGKLFQIEAIPPIAGDKTSEHVCGTKPFLLLPVIKDQAHLQKVCVRELCTIFESRYGKRCSAMLPRLQAYYLGSHNVNIVPSIDDDVCGPKTAH
jgi:hypothetical protein